MQPATLYRVQTCERGELVEFTTGPVNFLEACRVQNIFAKQGISARIRVVRSSTIKKGI